MKKTLVSALTTALVVGAASTTFAAANPFSDVPADHWAYDAVSQLAADGVIEGYGDTTFKGNRNITRYEMAQMVAKAMAKNTSGADKALVDKLAAEFAEELNNLGVRVSNLERNADMVKWNGEARYTYTSVRNEEDGYKYKKDNSDKALLRLEPTAEVNSHWKVKARLDAQTDMQSDTGDDGNVKLKRIWAQGNYKNFQVKLGKFASYNNDTFADTEFSGAEIAVGNKVKGILGAGRLSTTPIANSYWSVKEDKTFGDKANYQYLAVAGKAGKLDAGIHWHRTSTEDFDGWLQNDYKGGKTHNIYGVKLGYQFNKNIGIKGFYNRGTKVDYFKTAYNVEINYKGAQKENKGTWGAWVAYRQLGPGALVKSTYDVIQPYYKGWEVGANYTPFKNVVGTLRYGHSKDIEASNWKQQILFGRVQFFF